MELEIIALSNGPEGIARTLEGKTIFVERAVPGDTVEVSLIEEKKRFARARVERIISPSENRVASPCKYQSICGGCPWGLVSYDLQLISKRDNVIQQLVRIGGFERDVITELVEDTIASPKTYGYRNKIELRTSMSTGALELGYTAPGGTDIIPIDSCPLASGRASKAPKALRGALRYLAGAGNDLGIERVSLRHSSRTNDLEIALWTPTSSFPRAEAERILNDALSPTSIVRVLLKSTAKERVVSNVEQLGGKGFWRERLAGSSYEVSAPSFFQVNTEQAETLVNTVVDTLEPYHTVLDLYSGVGTFTLPLLKGEKDVISVESYGPAVRDQRRAVEAAGYEAEIIGGDVARELASIIDEVEGIVVDPPRAGLAPEVSEMLRDSDVERIVYVSCDPATLARDLAIICGSNSWQVDRITPVDMFPQTHHVETVVLMSRVKD